MRHFSLKGGRRVQKATIQRSVNHFRRFSSEISPQTTPNSIMYQKLPCNQKSFNSIYQLNYLYAQIIVTRINPLFPEEGERIHKIPDELQHTATYFPRTKQYKLHI